MKYCQSCVLPDSRPNLVIGKDDTCNACKNQSTKPTINWEQRKSSFLKVIETAKSKSKQYDCIIPVSGGKDSTWQTHLCIEYGLTPLAITWATPARTQLGQDNLNNLISLGVDHIDYRINPKVEKRFMWEAFKIHGSTALPMHMAIFSIPLKLSYQMNIPLIVYGENSAFEYGSEDHATEGFEMDEAWLSRFGVTAGTGPGDWLDKGFSKKDLAGYQRPSGEDLKSKNIRAIFLGQYFNWDPSAVKDVAKSVGFQFNAGQTRTGYYDYADIDDDFISIHHWMKWYKFGFTRLYDNLSLEIRHGRISREAAIETIRKTGDQCPMKDIEKCCEFMGVSTKDFFKEAEKFRNLKLWEKDGATWKIPDFIIDDWKW